MTTDTTNIPQSKIKLSSIKASAERLEWENLPEFPGVRVKVRSFRSAKFQLAMSPVRDRLRRKYGESVPDEEVSKHQGRLVAELILVDWEGFDEDYSREKSLEVLTDSEFIGLFNAIVNASIRVAQGNLDYIEEASKNLEPRSATI